MELPPPGTIVTVTIDGKYSKWFVEETHTEQEGRVLVWDWMGKRWEGTAILPSKTILKLSAYETINQPSTKQKHYGTRKPNTKSRGCVIRGARRNRARRNRRSN